MFFSIVVTVRDCFVWPLLQSPARDFGIRHWGLDRHLRKYLRHKWHRTTPRLLLGAVSEVRTRGLGSRAERALNRTQWRFGESEAAWYDSGISGIGWAWCCRFQIALVLSIRLSNALPPCCRSSALHPVSEVHHSSSPAYACLLLHRMPHPPLFRHPFPVLCLHSSSLVLGSTFHGDDLSTPETSHNHPYQ